MQKRSLIRDASNRRDENIGQSTCHATLLSYRSYQNFISFALLNLFRSTTHHIYTSALHRHERSATSYSQIYAENRLVCLCIVIEIEIEIEQ